MLETHKMNIFLAAVEEHSFSAAAKKLGMSQPAVSLQIQALEQHLGVELFLRSGRSVKVTEAGQSLIPLARQMLRLSNKIEETMCAIRGKIIGRLVVGCAATPGQYLLPRLILLFKQRHPDVHIQLRMMRADEVLASVLSQEIHLGVLPYLPKHRALNVREFMEDETALLVPVGHPWAGQASVSLADLISEDVTLLKEHNQRSSESVWAALEEAASPRDFHQSVIELGSTEAVISAVEAGLGIAILPQTAARRAAAVGQGVVLKFKEGSFTQALYFCSNKEHPEVCARVGFCDFVHTKEARDLIAEWMS
jgi:DNA-binding transcriptional LysR family regulator